MRTQNFKKINHLCAAGTMEEYNTYWLNVGFVTLLLIITEGGRKVKIEII